MLREAGPMTCKRRSRGVLVCLLLEASSVSYVVFPLVIFFQYLLTMIRVNHCKKKHKCTYNFPFIVDCLLHDSTAAARRRPDATTSETLMEAPCRSPSQGKFTCLFFPQFSLQVVCVTVQCHDRARASALENYLSTFPKEPVRPVQTQAVDFNFILLLTVILH